MSIFEKLYHFLADLVLFIYFGVDYVNCFGL